MKFTYHTYQLKSGKHLYKVFADGHMIAVGVRSTLCKATKEAALEIDRLKFIFNK